MPPVEYTKKLIEVALPLDNIEIGLGSRMPLWLFGDLD